MRTKDVLGLMLACLLCAQGARAGYDSGYYTDELHFDVSIPGMLDFDQKRAEDSPHTDGLPGGGAMYCAPTAAMDLFAFLALAFLVVWALRASTAKRARIAGASATAPTIGK